MTDNPVNTGNTSGGDILNIRESVLTGISNSLASINIQIATLAKELDKVSEENKRISLSVTSCENQLKKSLAQLKQEIIHIKKENNDLKKENKLLKDDIIQLKQSIRYNAIKISNFPKTENENLIAIIDKIFKQINFEFNLDFLQDYFRMKSRNDKYPPPIIVKFLKNKDKTSLLKLLRENKIRLSSQMIVEGSADVPIYISEYLSPELNFLFKQARINVRNNELKYAWVRNGQVFVKTTENSTPKIIRNNFDLNECLSSSSVMAEKVYEETDFDESDATDISTLSKDSKKRKLKNITRSKKIDKFFRPPEKKEK